MKKLMAYIDAGRYGSDEVVALASLYGNLGADGLYIFDYTKDEARREAFYDTMRKACRATDIPVMTGCFVKRFEDSKKAFYTGAEKVVLRYCDITGTTLYKESADRFKAKNIYVLADMNEVLSVCEELGQDVNLVISDACTDNLGEMLKGMTGDTAVMTDDAADGGYLGIGNVSAVATAAFVPEGTGTDTRIMDTKRALKAKGFDMNTFESRITFDELKLNSDGMIPCIVQDYVDGTVLMMAYMDREAFEKTVSTGVMTYYSRSRSELWVKGLTSGHFQYLRELSADCDKDTLLAKVEQVGAACHTGSRSCFFNEAVKHEYTEHNAYKVLSGLYDVITDRKLNPKEGSYTNYLFDKGIDKILKKCGEEATEMVIAAKNPNAEELKYEIADLLYHMSVLMVECGVDWEDVMTELANR